ncbi:MAG TPA: hypothetical protein VKU02_27660 [Gemmataceae bacterium]|nr:hypothetical protein [Gemmataceae bacterium]
MGMEQAVTFTAGSRPTWPAARKLLVSSGFVVQVRMIDGELTVPDEEPPENWRELRLGTAEGRMVTVRGEQDRVVLAIWGNADAGLVQIWNALTWAFAEAGKGNIHTADGLQSAAEYGRCKNLGAAPGSNAESGG